MALYSNPKKLPGCKRRRRKEVTKEDREQEKKISQ
jgi:hypothetical protein